MSEVTDNDDCGCNGDPIDTTPADVDKIKNTLNDTKLSLEKMLTTVEGMSFDVAKFDRIENELKKITDFMQSGEFVDSIELILQRNANSSVMTSSLYQDFLTKKENAVGSIFGSPTMQSLTTPEELRLIQNSIMQANKTKTPIGYVYIDDNGEQKFSPTEPEGVTSTPVYGD